MNIMRNNSEKNIISDESTFDRVNNNFIVFVSINVDIDKFFCYDLNRSYRLNPLLSINIYVPRDERFGHLKMSDFIAYALKAIAQFLKPELETTFSSTPNEFDKLQDILNLYEGGIELPNDLLQNIRKNIPAETLK